jgi:PLD-like domain
VSGFDITTLADFRPPRALCPICMTIWTESSPAWSPHYWFHCPCCATYFQHFPIGEANGPFGSGGIELPEPPGIPVRLGDDALQHAAALARHARDLLEHDESIVPLRSVLLLMLNARSFIHITSLSIDQFMLGVLEVVSQQVPVRAIISQTNESIRDELVHAQREAPSLQVRTYDSAGKHDPINHGKLIVVDGLIAVAGSTNLNHQAWRKAADHLETVAVDTQIDSVRHSNERYFSKHWWSLTPSVDYTHFMFGRWSVTLPGDPGYRKPESLTPAS